MSRGNVNPGYVTWEQYLETQQRLLANARPTGQGGGAAREGSALLQGLDLRIEAAHARLRKVVVTADQERVACK